MPYLQSRHVIVHRCHLLASAASGHGVGSARNLVGNQGLRDLVRALLPFATAAPVAPHVRRWSRGDRALHGPGIFHRCHLLAAGASDHGVGSANSVPPKMRARRKTYRRLV